jgi:hypothetical protein
MKHEALKPTNRRSTDPSNRSLYIDTCTSRDIRRYAVEVRWFILQHQIRNTPAVEIWEVKKDAWCLGNDLAIEEVQGMIHSHQTNKPPNLVLVIYHRSSLGHIAPVLWTEANYIRAWSIIESRCLAISQVWRAKLYNKCLLFILKKSLSPILPHNTWYFGPLIHMLSCPALCLYGNQALISLIPSLLHIISISLAISPLLYLL